MNDFRALDVLEHAVDHAGDQAGPDAVGCREQHQGQHAGQGDGAAVAHPGKTDIGEHERQGHGDRAAGQHLRAPFFLFGNYSVPQAEHERRPLERNTSESEATEQLQNLYKLEIILNDQENFGKHIDFFSCLFYPFSVLGERMLRL